MGGRDTDVPRVVGAGGVYNPRAHLPYRELAALAADTDARIAALEPPALRELAARGRVQSYRKDVVIIQEGDYGDTLHISTRTARASSSARCRSTAARARRR